MDHESTGKKIKNALNVKKIISIPAHTTCDASSPWNSLQGNAMLTFLKTRILISTRPHSFHVKNEALKYNWHRSGKLASFTL